MQERNQQPRDPGRHVHHWILDEPTGPICLAICRDCKDERAFRTWQQELEYVPREERALA